MKAHSCGDCATRIKQVRNCAFCYSDYDCVNCHINDEVSRPCMGCDTTKHPPTHWKEAVKNEKVN